MDWFGRAKIDFTTSPTPIALREKDGTATDLLQICQATVPPCQLNPLLFNGHAQTCWTATKSHGPPIHYRRRIFKADNAEFNGSFAVDFAVVDKEPGSEVEVDESLPPRTTYFTEAELFKMGSEDTRPMLVILHGLSGGSHEVYLRHAIAPLVDGGEWEACVINSRGCAKSKITTGLLYNARATWDTRQVVKWLRKTYPNRPLFGLGFSLGACILSNYLGEEGEDCQLKAAVVCANPWNLEVGNKVLKSTFIGHEIYLRSLGDSLRVLAFNHKSEIEKYTNVDMENLSSVKYLYEFDRAYQCPTWGYPTEDAYYRDASSVDSLLAIRIPLLALNAMDDPIATHLGLPFPEARQNPYTVLCTTSLGGHLGWFEIGGGRWHAKPVCNFLNHMAFKVDLDSINPRAIGKPTFGTSESAGNFDPIRRKMHVNLNK
ncbi:Uu.00g091910.m01.CDS01 [Anthostomella pinea]|uniref:alcohol O-acetyltransferase n=1 Tax=Anthostomella pinea TaxID=933095 RepID=A0AAI8VPC6_9PEZI|nr:Uu.00g091910.m01.CDS01 [Anthostomella pinea]